MPPGRRRVSRLELAYATVCLGLLLGGSLWLDRNGTPVGATVTGKHEELASEIDDLVVGVDSVAELQAETDPVMDELRTARAAAAARGQKVR